MPLRPRKKHLQQRMSLRSLPLQKRTLKKASITNPKCSLTNPKCSPVSATTTAMGTRWVMPKSMGTAQGLLFSNDPAHGCDSPLPAVLVRRTTGGVLCVPPQLGQATASAVPSFFELLRVHLARASNSPFLTIPHRPTPLLSLLLGLKKASSQGALIQIKIRQGQPAASRRLGLSIIRPARDDDGLPAFYRRCLLLR